MKMPGDWLLAIARALLDQAIVSDVVEPTIADLRAEWLRADSNRVARLRSRVRGYLAFWSLLAMSPFVFRRWPGRTPGVPFWQIQRSHEMRWRTRIQLVTVLLIVGLAGGYVVGRVRPPLYQSSAVLKLVPSNVPGFLTGNVENLGARLRSTGNIVASRTRLERLITDFDLYPRERQSWIMEDVVQKMRNDLDIDEGPGGTFVIKYTGTHPKTVLKVTEKVASIFADERRREQERTADDSMAFLESRIDETGARLQRISAEAVQNKGALSRPRQLELEAVEASYKNLLMRREDALAAVNAESRQLGEQFVLLDAAQLPEQPIGMSPFTYTLLGGVAGLDLAIVIMLGVWLWRLLRERRADLARRRALAQG